MKHTTFLRLSQQAGLAGALNIIVAEIFCLQETRTQDLSQVTKLSTNTKNVTHYLCCSGGIYAEASNRKGIGTVLNDKAEAGLL